ncbi:MAG: hypothetical protein AAB460_00580 [Patescibacteria group bacterium]
MNDFEKGNQNNDPKTGASAKLHERLVEATSNITRDVPKVKRENDFFDTLGDNLKRTVGEVPDTERLQAALDRDMEYMRDTVRRSVKNASEAPLLQETEMLSLQIKVGKEAVAMEVPIGTSEDDIERIVLENEAVKALVGGKSIKKFYLKKRLKEGTVHIFLSETE